VSKKGEPDSRDWLPPEDMRGIFEGFKRARASMGIDGDGPEEALNHLIDAVEELATHVAGDRGRRDG
jgi:hypothetical protein